ncbi:MAG: BlaI/MecI/CopY family transcriptional regulator [Pirellulaceae bacterium]
MSAKKKLPALTEPQLEIMDVLWEQGKGTVASVWNAIRSRRPVARNTVQTTLVRMEEKGYLRHKEEGNAFVYYPTSKRETVLGGMLQGLVDTAFSGSTAGLVLTLLDKQDLSDDDVARIQAMLDDHKQRNKKG